MPWWWPYLFDCQCVAAPVERAGAAVGGAIRGGRARRRLIEFDQTPPPGIPEEERGGEEEDGDYHPL